MFAIQRTHYSENNENQDAWKTFMVEYFEGCHILKCTELLFLHFQKNLGFKKKTIHML
jgi:hypothetical protein